MHHTRLPYVHRCIEGNAARNSSANLRFAAVNLHGLGFAGPWATRPMQSVARSLRLRRHAAGVVQTRFLPADQDLPRSSSVIDATVSVSVIATHLSERSSSRRVLLGELVSTICEGFESEADEADLRMAGLV